MTTGNGSIVLGHVNYGKSQVRVVKVVRDTPQHSIKDLDVAIALEGDFSDAYLNGDNTKLLATDTMRNAVYALAQQHPLESIEAFGLVLIDHFLKTGPTVQAVKITITEFPWQRIEVAGKPHEHAFVRGAGERTAKLTGDSSGARSIESGIDKVTVLKTTNSGWEDFHRDELTTLPDTNDRILATVVTASWEYDLSHSIDYNAEWQSINQQILSVFTDHYSPSVQNTLYRIGSAVLEAHPAVERIHFSFPNKHHLLYDLGRFGLENNLEVFHVTQDPYGLIEGTVERRKEP
jgi:urate oxidase